MMQDPSVDLLAGELADRFGDLGLVCVLVIRRTSEAATIESFVMSCRAMGFGFEHLMLAQAIARQGDRRILGRFVPSDRNEPCSNLYRGAGFEEQEPGLWMKPQLLAVETPIWITVAER